MPILRPPAWRWFLPRWLRTALVSVVLVVNLLLVGVGFALANVIVINPYAFGGGIQVAVGSFAAQDSTGTQVVAGVGFTPTAVLLWTTGSQSTSGTWAGTAYGSVGMTAGSANSYAFGWYDEDGQATANASRRMAAKAITQPSADGTGVRWEAGLSSFDADGFTLDWTTAQAGFTPRISYLAITGTAAKVLSWQEPAATGNKAVTGAGFSPALAIHAFCHQASAPAASAADAYAGIGVMNDAGEQWTVGVGAADAVSPSNASRWQRTDSCIALPSPGEVETQRATYVSMDADGFTVNFPTISGGTGNRYMMTLCLDSPRSKIGSFAKSEAAAPVTQDVATGLTFVPLGGLFATDTTNGSTTPQSYALLSLGATAASGEQVQGYADADNANPTIADCVWYDGKAIAVVNTVGSGGTTEAVADVTLGTTTTATWTTNAAGAREILYLLFG